MERLVPHDLLVLTPSGGLREKKKCNNFKAIVLIVPEYFKPRTVFDLSSNPLSN